MEALICNCKTGIVCRWIKINKKDRAFYDICTRGAGDHRKAAVSAADGAMCRKRFRCILPFPTLALGAPGR
jgi:hypothetical protein